MSNYKPPKWHYEYGVTGKGYNLKLLSVDELLISGELLKHWLRPINMVEYKSWYKNIVATKQYDPIWIQCNRLINKLSKHPANDISDLDMNALNDELNRIFSDVGWREMKKKFRQQSKRTRKVKVEFSTSLIARLDAFIEQQGLSTRDEGLDELLSFFNDHNENSEVNNAE